MTTDFEEFSALVTSPLARLKIKKIVRESEISSGGSKDLEVRVAIAGVKIQIGVIFTHTHMHGQQVNTQLSRSRHLSNSQAHTEIAEKLASLTRDLLFSPPAYQKYD